MGSSKSKGSSSSRGSSSSSRSSSSSSRSSSSSSSSSRSTSSSSSDRYSRNMQELWQINVDRWDGAAGRNEPPPDSRRHDTWQRGYDSTHPTSPPPAANGGVTFSGSSSRVESAIGASAANTRFSPQSTPIPGTTSKDIWVGAFIVSVILLLAYVLDAPSPPTPQTNANPTSVSAPSVTQARVAATIRLLDQPDPTQGNKIAVIRANEIVELTGATSVYEGTEWTEVAGKSMEGVEVRGWVNSTFLVLR